MPMRCIILCVERERLRGSAIYNYYLLARGCRLAGGVFQRVRTRRATAIPSSALAITYTLT
jgi:hypothetical protein